ncbi:hypothetical protein FJU08_08540 [Martelella alba]|uniref:Transmembrane protein n=1 Tax=Martelella alba TaxID=2590451 RepID=A0A506UDV3_9HYPH|nr:hypothetical protein [Martelella alba]TPW31778.1 hypothetical protein FJU08_08540 [Martelella alba]
MPKIAHRLAGGGAMLLVAMFLTATLTSELLIGQTAVPGVKRAILFGIALLIPLLIITGTSGLSLARRMKGPAIRAKLIRMRLIAANGVLILLPAAIYLDHKAEAQQFDLAFVTVQFLEIAAGLIQLTLLTANMRAGLRLAAKRGQSADFAR